MLIDARTTPALKEARYKCEKGEIRVEHMTRDAGRETIIGR
jgi:hypothetical protein